MSEATVNIYLVDQETKRKLLFKVNPLMVGKAENTTIIFPDGLEYKLVQAEPSDLFKTNQYFDNNQDLLAKAAESFPEFGYPEKPVPTKEEQMVVLESVITEAMKTTENAISTIWNSSEENKKMVLEVAYQKFGQWITTNRSLEYAKEMQRARWVDPCYPMDYAERQVGAFMAVNDALKDEDQKMSFIGAIQILSQTYSDMHTDYRRAGGKTRLMEPIRYYEPVQIMQRPVIERIIELHQEGTNVMLNECVKAEKEGQADIDAGFWKMFTDAMAQSLKCAIENKKYVESRKDFLEKQVNGENYQRYFGISAAKVLGEYIDKYLTYNKEVQLVGTGESDKDTQALAKDMQENGIGKLVKDVADIELDLVLYFKGEDEDKIEQNTVNDTLFAIASGLPMVIQQNQNPNVMFSSTYSTCKTLKEDLMEACGITEEMLHISE